MFVRILMAVMAGAILLSASTVHAAFAVFTDQAEFEALFFAQASEDFEASPLGALAAGENDLGQLDFTLSAASLDSLVQEPGLINASRELQLAIDLGEMVLLDEFNASPVFGFGGTWNLDSPDSSLTLILPDSDPIILADVLGSNSGFVGILSSTVFTSLTLQLAASAPASEIFQLDDVVLGLTPKSRFEEIAAVPEPSTMVLMAVAGIGGLFGRSRLNRS